MSPGSHVETSKQCFVLYCTMQEWSSSNLSPRLGSNIYCNKQRAMVSSAAGCTEAASTIEARQGLLGFHGIRRERLVRRMCFTQERISSVGNMKSCWAMPRSQDMGIFEEVLRTLLFAPPNHERDSGWGRWSEYHRAVISGVIK